MATQLAWQGTLSSLSTRTALRAQGSNFDSPGSWLTHFGSTGRRCTTAFTQDPCQRLQARGEREQGKMQLLWRVIALAVLARHASAGSPAGKAACMYFCTCFSRISKVVGGVSVSWLHTGLCL